MPVSSAPDLEHETVTSFVLETATEHARRVLKAHGTVSVVHVTRFIRMAVALSAVSAGTQFQLKALTRRRRDQGRNPARHPAPGANLDGATLVGVTWNDTTCPDGTNSDNDGGTCVNNLG